VAALSLQEDSSVGKRFMTGLVALATMAGGIVPLAVGAAPAGARVGDAVFPDFNNDGRAEVVVSIDEEDIGSAVDGGAVQVLYGSPFRATPPNDQFFSNATPGFTGSAVRGARFGDAWAAGDFDGDGFDDLAIGEWGATIDGFAAAGQVHVIYGGVHGLQIANGYQHIDQAVAGVENNPNANDQFGRALAAGDVNGDGHDDLVVGVPREDIGGGHNAGTVHVFEGTPSGLTFANDKFFRQGVGVLEDQADDEDIFGSAVAVGDFDNDGNDDIAVGAQGETLNDLDVDPNNDISQTGAIHIIDGNSTFANVGSTHQFFTENNLGTGAAANSRLGCDFAVGNFNGDAFADLAVCADGRRVTGVPNAGATYVLRGGGGGLSALPSATGLWTFAHSGIKGSPEQGDNWGDSSAAGDFNHDGRDDLAISVDKKDLNGYPGVDHGMVVVLNGSAGFLTTTGYKAITEATKRMPGSPQSGDEFGSLLRSGNYSGDAFDDLYTSAAGEAVSGKVGAGGLYLLYGRPAGVAGAGSKYYTQDTPGFQESAEPGDHYGGT
jgi:hypothetical protein